jgi:predicted nucleotidyltransferase
LAGENKKNLFPLDMLIASDKYLENVLKRRIEIEYRGVIVPVISIEDLIILKSISFRDIDRFDIENLINAGNSIDWDYLGKTSARLIPQEQRDFINARKR